MALSFRTSGTGDPVVFIHGCPTAPFVLEPFARAVAADHRAIQLALPGYDSSPSLTGAWTVADLHEAIEATVAPLLRGRPATIVGFSGGAYHALALAARGVLQVRGVFTLSGLMAQSAAERDGFRQFAAALRQGVDLHGLAPDRFLSPAWKASHPDDVRAVTAWLDAVPAPYLATELEAFAAAPDLDAGVAALGIPIVARAGSLDVAVPLYKSEAIVRAARAGTLQVVAGAGHALPCEDVDGTTQAIVAALHG